MFYLLSLFRLKTSSDINGYARAAFVQRDQAPLGRFTKMGDQGVPGQKSFVVSPSQDDQAWLVSSQAYVALMLL